MSAHEHQSSDPAQVAQVLAAALDAAGCEYALGGAIALGFWAAPRGTLDVDLTLFLSPDQPTACIRLLQQIGCEVPVDEATRLLSEHGFCHAQFGGLRIDVFLPLVPFYDEARGRRQDVLLGESTVKIWDAETLCVFKMMFFRRKDLADIEQILRARGHQMDSNWVDSQIVGMYGQRDPRVSQWRELVSELRGES